VRTAQGKVLNYFSLQGWLTGSWFSPDIIACEDACFAHKRADIGDEGILLHPQTSFLCEEQVGYMEKLVEKLRPAKKRGSDKRKRPAQPECDDVLEATGLPTSILDQCERTFEAADDRRQKASTQYFKDTGLMALLCRHDRVLFMVNMQTAGEKQFYALSLIDSLFHHLPSKATVGILYDIGCALDRSCAKWGFLSQYRARLQFAVSVFHAYGHEWPCQLLYNPRLRPGFGFSNGEGCERLWALLKGLVCPLRISGVSSCPMTPSPSIRLNIF
jgi:hypothetical protein